MFRGLSVWRPISNDDSMSVSHDVHQNLDNESNDRSPSIVSVGDMFDYSIFGNYRRSKVSTDVSTDQNQDESNKLSAAIKNFKRGSISIEKFRSEVMIANEDAQNESENMSNQSSEIGRGEHGKESNYRTQSPGESSVVERVMRRSRTAMESIVTSVSNIHVSSCCRCLQHSNPYFIVLKNIK